MFVYLDESGDTGFRFNRGSSRCFVVALLFVDDPVPVHAAIDELRRDLRLPPYREFHFTNSNNRIRPRFLRRLARHDVRIRAIVIDKMLMTAGEVANQRSFYRVVVSLLLQHAADSISGATFILDESVRSKKKQRTTSLKFCKRGRAW